MYALDTVVIFRIDQVTRQPIEPLASVVPPVTPQRFVADHIESESASATYTVTRKRVSPDFTVSTNSYRNPLAVQAKGTLTPALGGVGAGRLVELKPGWDIAKAKLLRAMADERLPVLWVTPTESLIVMLTAVNRTWTVGDGDSNMFDISGHEWKVATKIQVAANADVGALAVGNASTTNGGEQLPADSVVPDSSLAVGEAPL